MLDDQPNRTQDPLMRTSLFGRTGADHRDPLGPREAIRVVCDRCKARGLLWSLEIAASAISSSEQWADVQTRYRNTLNYADPPVLKLSRTAIWEEPTRDAIHPETQVLEPVYTFGKPRGVKVADVDLWRTRLEFELKYFRHGIPKTQIPNPNPNLKKLQVQN